MCVCVSTPNLLSILSVSLFERVMELGITRYGPLEAGENHPLARLTHEMSLYIRFWTKLGGSRGSGEDAESEVY